MNTPHYPAPSPAHASAHCSHGDAAATFIDPVCGMKIDPTDAAATRDHDGTTIYFCSKGCAETFDADPHRYAHGPSGAGHH